MCRLFGLSAGAEPVSARIWLLEAPDSLAAQSHHNPDGTGLGIFDGTRPVVHKAPIAAFDDAAFAREAREERSPSFLAHIRFASTGAKTMENTHPFEQDGRLFAHNGVLQGLGQIEAELGADTALLQGQTDSERLFALITHEIRGNGGDVRAGIVAAVGWIVANVPIYSLNLILTTPTELFALRYPDTNTLFLLERPAGGGDGGGALHHRSSLGTSRALRGGGGEAGGRRRQRADGRRSWLAGDRPRGAPPRRRATSRSTRRSPSPDRPRR